MKSTGIVRKVDHLGRIVLPKELRDTLNYGDKEPLDIFVENDKIILRKHSNEMACEVTGEITDENKRFGNGSIVLSPKGAEILFKELQSQSIE